MRKSPSTVRLIAILAFSVVAFLPLALGSSAVQLAEGRQGMVVSGHPQATQAGVDILRAGGNAVDAAVAVSLALGVAEPYGSGLGGKLILLYHSRETGKTHCIEGMDVSPQLLDVAAYRKLPEADRSNGIQSVCVPGLPAGILLAHENWGKLPRADVIAPSIRLARDGFEVLPGTVKLFQAQEKKLLANPELGRLYLPNGELPEVGSKLPNEDLARTLESLAASGADAFYKGDIASAIISESRRLGGPLNTADLAGYSPRTGEPLIATFGGVTIATSPPPATGGAMLTLTLQVLENHLPDSPALRDAATMDRVLRAYREVNSKVWQRIADSEDALTQLAALRSDASIEALREVAFGSKTVAGDAPFLGMAEALNDEAITASTTHFVVVDGEGNVVSATQSLSHHFGSGIVVPGTGVVLNNSMSNFSVFTRDNPNVIAQGKRPRSTITPAILLRDGRPIAAVGVPGAARIPTAMLQTLLDVLHFGRSFGDSISDTRWHLVTPGADGSQPRVIHFEPSVDQKLIEGLRALGWTPETRSDTEYFGGINAIEIGDDGRLVGVADLRRTNSASGY